MNRLASLAEEVEEIFRREPSLVRSSFPSLLVVGDTHGDVESTKNALKAADERGAAVVFLGDYVDRGPYQIENITAVFERKKASPSTCILLRGNHETLAMNTYYGFLDTVVRRHGLNTYNAFLKAFTMMPYALQHRDKVLCVHGGLPEGLENVSQLESLPRGQEDPDDPLAMQLLWNDPREGLKGFAESARGGGALYFGEDVFTEFMNRNGLSLTVRSHEPMPEGYRYFFNRRLLTVFSCRFYSVPPKAALLTHRDVEILSLG
ncbi:MAG: metallophosphoesterase [Candidatus Caldarchaeum sp.]|nr:metallophosphoesterase [Candidatus Caldarchaeum sp.]MDW7977481.1 metallophosphoesterase [Candidatus Caldarchaeum sp.]